VVTEASGNDLRPTDYVPMDWLRGGEIVVMEGKELSKEPDGLWWTIPKAKTRNTNRASATDHRVPLAGRAEKLVQRRLELRV